MARQRRPDQPCAASPTLTAEQARFDWIVVFSYRYHHAFHAVRALAPKAVLVPTAERDAAVGLSIFGPIFRGVRALMFNSHEERAMLQHAAGRDLPGVVVGIGSDVPERPRARPLPAEARHHGPVCDLRGPHRREQGLQGALRVLPALRAHDAGPASAGADRHVDSAHPDDPRIRHLGFLPDQDKFDAMAAAEVLIMPSYYESLSMVALEAWALGKPVLANGRCDVLKGQCLRSNAGPLLRELRGVCRDAVRHHVRARAQRHARPQRPSVFPARTTRGRSSSASTSRRSTAWREPRDRQPALEPLPGFLARRRRTLPPADDVLAAIPAGAVRP